MASPQRTRSFSKIRPAAQLVTLPEDVLISTLEAATLVARGRETLRRWRKCGIGPRYLKHPAHKDRAEYRIGDVRDWLSERSTDPAVKKQFSNKPKP